MNINNRNISIIPRSGSSTAGLATLTHIAWIPFIFYPFFLNFLFVSLLFEYSKRLKEMCLTHTWSQNQGI